MRVRRRSSFDEAKVEQFLQVGSFKLAGALTAQGAAVYPKRLAVFTWTDYAEMTDTLRQAADGRE